ncbi:acyltransferase [Bifidobacterium cebidarum]|uniref:Galactoside O-acetyltransferase n=1 Tax=Bifidobacterium cebidarum TaxID=2650773 RepID=A0A6I1G8Y3_9BIFI|nr:acyltransferase [Bifidobacterium cebidarum]KAB7788103.1 galactoside O-acetyltransferase [Bifidobacterium cebidarum]
MEFNSEITKSDKIIILLRTGFKFIRGIWKRLFLSEAHGLLLIGRHVTISHARHIRCGRNVKFEDYSEIHGLCKEGLIFGDNVTIGRGVMIRPSSYYGGDLGHGLVIGNNSSIGPHGYIGCSGPINIGNNVMIGPKCSLFAENHVFNDSSKSIKSQGVKQKGITIGDDCWIGSNVIILDGVTIGSHVVIGAGTLVTKDIPNNSLVLDKRNKTISDMETK